MRDPRTSRRWRRVRARILLRDGYRCQIRTEGICTGRATEVDHVLPIAAGGSVWRPANLRAACRDCNRARRGGFFSTSRRGESRLSRFQSQSPRDAGSRRTSSRNVRIGALSPDRSGS